MIVIELVGMLHPIGEMMSLAHPFVRDILNIIHFHFSYKHCERLIGKVCLEWTSMRRWHRSPDAGNKARGVVWKKKGATTMIYGVATSEPKGIVCEAPSLRGIPPMG
jgi:hypothetical protein